MREQRRREGGLARLCKVVCMSVAVVLDLRLCVIHSSMEYYYVVDDLGKYWYHSTKVLF